MDIMITSLKFNDYKKELTSQARASAKNFPGRGGATKKISPKISKKFRKIALFASSRGS